MSEAQTINLNLASPIVRNALSTARTEITSAVYRPGTLPEYASVGLRDILRAWRVAHAVIMSDAFAPNNVKAAAVAQLQEVTAQAVDDLELRFNAQLAATKTELDGGVMPLAPDAAMRLWNRLKAQLDAGVELPDLLADADLMTLQVLEEELPAWHRARNPLSVRMADDICKGDLAQVRQRRYALATPDQRAKMEFADALPRGAEITAMAVTHARHHLKFSTAKESLTLPTWGGGSLTV
jgi:hypothetical protein